MDCIKITTDKIEVTESLSNLSNPSCGATACFIGTTRDNFEGKKVKQLSYEAYGKMALKELRKISDTIKSKWQISNVILIHRIGTVPVCETSVLVAASSVHRKDALEAVSFGIDAIKTKVPIWKKEEYEDGTYQWKENCECKNSIKHLTNEMK
ncbi:Molybdopterin synthase catalytic subunit like protein [Argiope bruennichi]|uniref:Molybdopterin synthase catalytic subunit n=1 Tax=Argiope bruennichi TaxID=94029 RepID=A0A8T0F4Y0_ARGBR|nr:Molybdopterin synthase catalytic subunit like protein [Argiope bruennichi]